MIHTAGLLSANKFNFKILSFVSMLLISIVIFSSCSKTETNVNANNEFVLESVLNSLGLDKEDAIEKFSIDNNGELGKILYCNIPVEMNLEFENNKLLRIRYDFGTNTDVALKFANEVYKSIEQKYGECDTYKTLPGRIEGLTVEKYLSDDLMQYKEYWIDTDVDFSAIIPEKYTKSKRVDLGIGIDKIPQDETITEVYIGGIVNSINTVKLN